MVPTSVDGDDVPARLRAVPSIRDIATGLNRNAGEPAYMRVLNAVQNLNSAQDALEQAWFGPGTPPGKGSLAFADSELEDAMGVLEESRIHGPARVRIAFARKHGHSDISGG